jgi:hypothetical protein
MPAIIGPYPAAKVRLSEAWANFVTLAMRDVCGG